MLPRISRGDSGYGPTWCPVCPPESWFSEIGLITYHSLCAMYWQPVLETTATIFVLGLRAPVCSSSRLKWQI